MQQYTVPGLLSGRDYMFRIRPVNRMGVGEPLEQAQPLRLVSPYSKSKLFSLVLVIVQLAVHLHYREYFSRDEQNLDKHGICMCTEHF